MVGGRRPLLTEILGAVLPYHFSLDIVVFVNILDSQWQVSQQSIVQSIA